MKIVWTRDAEQDREAIWTFLVARDPAAAVRLDQRFSDVVAQLADFPLIGHPGEVAGTRELTPHRRYRVIYEVSGEIVWIVALMHTARQWPPLHPVSEF